MNKSIWLLFLKMIFVSFYFPVGFTLVPALAFTPVGAWGYLIDGCSGLNACLMNPLVDIYSSQKFLRMLMLAWGFGLIMVFAMTYQNLKPEIHQWFRKLR
jgi:hypothetical protein